MTTGNFDHDNYRIVVTSGLLSAAFGVVPARPVESGVEDRKEGSEDVHAGYPKGKTWPRCRDMHWFLYLNSKLFDPGLHCDAYIALFLHPP